MKTTMFSRLDGTKYSLRLGRLRVQMDIERKDPLSDGFAPLKHERRIRASEDVWSALEAGTLTTYHPCTLQGRYTLIYCTGDILHLSDPELLASLKSLGLQILKFLLFGDDSKLSCK